MRDASFSLQKDALPYFQALRTIFPALELLQHEGEVVNFYCVDGLYFTRLRFLIQLHFEDVLNRAFPGPENAGKRAVVRAQSVNLFRRCAAHITHTGLQKGACHFGSPGGTGVVSP